MQTLLDAGIIDLGGNGEDILEIEFLDNKNKHTEAFYRIDKDIFSGYLSMLDTKISHGNNTLTFCFGNNTLIINLKNHCKKIIALRLPESMGGEDISDLFQS